MPAFPGMHRFEMLTILGGDRYLPLNEHIKNTKTYLTVLCCILGTGG